MGEYREDRFVKRIIKNSAKCIHCGEEITSEHGHDFTVHYCPKERKQSMKWAGKELVPDGNKITWNFAVDGGNSYIRRCGDGYVDTSIFYETPPPSP